MTLDKYLGLAVMGIAVGACGPHEQTSAEDVACSQDQNTETDAILNYCREQLYPMLPSVNLTDCSSIISMRSDLTVRLDNPTCNSLEILREANDCLWALNSVVSSCNQK